MLGRHPDDLQRSHGVRRLLGKRPFLGGGCKADPERTRTTWANVIKLFTAVIYEFS